VKALKNLTATGKILAAAHITGGGLESNLGRVLPEGISAQLDYNWKVPEIFEAIGSLGKVEESEMRRVFNMGIGIALIIRPEDLDTVTWKASQTGTEITKIGTLSHG
jgi:phosphoribosylformylglycinamidine cyclo-ligase